MDRHRAHRLIGRALDGFYTAALWILLAFMITVFALPVLLLIP